ncbi:MAG TPA: tetratricopeptide repeat protein [Polyangia bacterium]
MNAKGWLVAATAAALLCTSAFARAQGRAGSDSPGQQALADAMKAFQADDYATAETKFKEAIGADSTLTDAYWKLAAIYYRNKKYGDAVAVLRRCPDQQNLDVREQLGLSLYRSANPPPAEAIKLLDDVADKRPSSFAAQLQLGQHYFKSDPKRAANAFELYLRHRPPAAAESDALVHEKLGTDYILMHDWDAAQGQFEGILRSKPNDMTAKLLLGTVYVGKRDEDPKACSQAITLFERILGEAHRQPSIYYNLAICYLKNNRAFDAQREAELYTRTHPTDSKGHLLLGEALYAEGQYPKALGAFQAARNYDRNNPTVIAKIGLTDVKLRNYDAAIAELEQAEAADGSNVDVLCAEVEAYGAKKNQMKLNAKAEKLEPMVHDARALSCAAQAYYLNGNDEKAMPTLQAVVALEPHNAGAKGKLVKVYNRIAGRALAKNDLPRAQSFLVDASRLLPDDIMTNRNLGLVLLLAHRYAEAQAPLERANRKLNNNDLITNRLLARALVGEGKRDQAKLAYEKAAGIALRTRGLDLAGVYTELGPLYGESGQLDQAVAVLEQAVKEAGSSPIAQVAARNLGIAYLHRGLSRMRDPKQTDGALDDIQHATAIPGVFTAKESNAITCAQWQAAYRAGKIQTAEEALARAKASGGCKLKPAYERVGMSFLEAITNYRDSQNLARRELAAKQLPQLRSRASGPVLESINLLARSALELLGYDFYQKSDERRAEATLKSASRVGGRGDKRALEHNLAVLDMMLGKAAQAEKVLTGLAGKPPEALVNLGILADRHGDGKTALSYYRKAWDRGVHLPKLKEWIDVKERLWGAN